MKIIIFIVFVTYQYMQLVRPNTSHIDEQHSPAIKLVVTKCYFHARTRFSIIFAILIKKKKNHVENYWIVNIYLSLKNDDLNAQRVSER